MKKIAKSSFALVITMIFLGFFVLSQKGQEACSLSELLKNYRFESTVQKEAVQDLFQKSGVIPAGKTWDDVFPKRSNKLELVQDVLTMVQETQAKFTLRKGIQERWQVSPLEWMAQEPEKIMKNLEMLGFVKEIVPQQKTVDAICILGATLPTMEKRITYVNQLIQAGIQANAIILLAGERYITAGVDGAEEKLRDIAYQQKVVDFHQLTETHLIKYAYENSPLSRLKIPVHVIHTPKRDLPRPTTQTTLEELIQWLKNHPEIKTIMFVSNQPYVNYQKAIVETVFQHCGVVLPFEMVGSSASENAKVQSLIEGLGSYLYAATPLVLKKIGVSFGAEPIQTTLKKLYAQNPLVYRVLPS